MKPKPKPKSTPAAGKPVIGVVGTFQVGKSTLINCLLGDSLADMGEGVSTTHAASAYAYGESEEVSLFAEDARLKVLGLDEFRRTDRRADPDFRRHNLARFSIRRDVLSRIDIIDTPGVNASGDQAPQDSAIAAEWMSRCDALLILMENRQLSTELRDMVIAPLRDVGKPFIAVMNCSSHGRFNPRAELNLKTAAVVARELENLGCLPHSLDGATGVWSCNLAWYWVAMMQFHTHDGLYLDARMRELLQARESEVHAFCHSQGRERPAPSVLADWSRVEPLIRFLTADGLEFHSVLGLLSLHEAMRELKSELISILQP